MKYILMIMILAVSSEAGMARAFAKAFTKTKVHYNTTIRTAKFAPDTTKVDAKLKAMIDEHNKAESRMAAVFAISNPASSEIKKHKNEIAEWMREDTAKQGEYVMRDGKVKVRGYFRSDGTFVNKYTRAYPGEES